LWWALPFNATWTVERPDHVLRMKLGLALNPEISAGNRNVPADQASYVTLCPGDTLDGRFRLLETINQGGMATVFKAEDLHQDNQLVAVKVPLMKYASGVGAWSREEREEEMGLRLNHPYILKFVPVEGHHRYYVVTEYVNGHSVAEHLKKEGRLAEEEAVSIVRRICEALRYLHEKGVVHYDLKPANIMLCADGSIRLIDFGLAQPVETSRFHLRGPAPPMGSVAYISPEQIQRKRGRPSADIYSLGGMLYEMLTGSPPFPGDDPYLIGSQRLTGDPAAPRALNAEISPQVEEIVLRALQRDPARRYLNAAAMLVDLAAPEQVVVTGLSGRLQPSTRWRRNWRRIRWFALCFLLPIAVQLLLYLLIWRRYNGKH
jgi:serine/threonine protein kinase